MSVAFGSLAKAAFVGANTVYGPSADKVETKSAAFKAATKVEKFLFPDAMLTIVLPVGAVLLGVVMPPGVIVLPGVVPIEPPGVIVPGLPIEPPLGDCDGLVMGLAGVVVPEVPPWAWLEIAAKIPVETIATPIVVAIDSWKMDLDMG